MSTQSVNVPASTENSGLRVALISTDYPPLRTSAAVQMRDLAMEMLRQGHDPVVIVPTVNLAIPWTVEILDEVKVIRLAAPHTRGKSYIRRAISELLLPFVSIFRLYRSPFWNDQWDLISWYSPTIFFGPLVWFMKRSNGARTYLILRDIFPEWALDLGLMKKGLSYNFFKMVANFQYSVADTIGVQTKSNMSYLENWSRQSGKRLEVLHNWQAPASNVGSTIDISTTRLAGRKIIVYIGNMGIAQGMDILIEVASQLIRRHDLGFIFVGRGTEVSRLKTIAATRATANTMFFDEVDSREMTGLLSQCRIGLLSLDARHKTHNIPGKFLTYLLAGLPVIARVNPGTDLASIIVDEGVGRVYDGESAQVLCDFVEEIIDNEQAYSAMSERGRNLGKKMFAPDRAVTQIVATVTRS